ncbi:unnamed protein product [Rhizophagus irregularis]|nr:unnamed protein product [Rhizophagus irregularis]
MIENYVINKIFIGDKSYIRRSKRKQWTGKLNPKMERSILIFIKLEKKERIQLRTMDGKVLRTPVNGSLLKLYHDRQNWEPIIVASEVETSTLGPEVGTFVKIILHSSKSICFASSSAASARPLLLSKPYIMRN